MKIATWNVNSVRARHERVLAWLAKAQPDVLCIQELKVTDDAFDYDAFREAGYHALVHGQRTYNGVAILCQDLPAEVAVGLGDDVDDPQARLIAATVAGVRFVNVYVPNGQEVGSDKWAYKLRWLARLRAYLERTARPSDRLVLCGDLNVAVDDHDVAHPEIWAATVLCHPEARAALAGVWDWGLVDVFRKHKPDGGVYSWWDYRRGAFGKNDGLRIDHILATEAMAAKSRSAEVDRDERKGDKPSDHAPVVAVFGE